MALPVGENAASGGERWPRIGPGQTEDKAADPRVGAGRKQLRHLHAGGERTVQVLHEMPDDHADEGAVAHHQNVKRDAVEAVAG